MALTIILMCIAFAVLLIIAYMIYNDYQIQQEIDKKLLVSKQKEIINETDDILLNVTQIPFSSQLVTILQKRVLYALEQVLAVNQNAMAVKQRVTDIKEQIKANISTPSAEPSFAPPKDTDMALRMLKVLRRIRKILRIEFNRGRVSQQELVREDKRLANMIFKIQFSNLVRTIDEAEMTKQYGTMEELVNSGLRSLRELGSDDPWFENLEEHLREKKDFLAQQINMRHKKEIEEEKAKEKEGDDIDQIFGLKKKW